MRKTVGTYQRSSTRMARWQPIEEQDTTWFGSLCQDTTSSAQLRPGSKSAWPAEGPSLGNGGAPNRDRVCPSQLGGKREEIWTAANWRPTPPGTNLGAGKKTPPNSKVAVNNEVYRALVRIFRFILGQLCLFCSWSGFRASVALVVRNNLFDIISIQGRSIMKTRSASTIKTPRFNDESPWVTANFFLGWGRMNRRPSPLAEESTFLRYWWVPWCACDSTIFRMNNIAAGART